MKYLGLHNKPKAAVHSEHLPMGPLEEEVEEEVEKEEEDSDLAYTNEF
jgi:hypothetical protein